MIGAPRQQNYFFFNDTATTEIYTLSLHDALPISRSLRSIGIQSGVPWRWLTTATSASMRSRYSAYSATSVDRKSTRLNSSHANNPYPPFSLKKKRDAQAAIRPHRARRAAEQRIHR